MLKKATYVLLACMLTLATSGVSVFKHYCSGQLQEAKVFQEAECADHEQLAAQHTSCCDQSQKSSCQIQLTDCCDETVELRKIDQYQVKIQQALTTNLPVIIMSAPVELTASAVNYIHFKQVNKSPPFTVPDIPVQVQSFLL